MTDTPDDTRPKFVLVPGPDGYPALAEPPEHVPARDEIAWEPYDAVVAIRRALALVQDYLSDTDAGLALVQSTMARKRRLRPRPLRR